MKEVFVSKSFNLIQAKYNYNQDDQDRIRYGLEIIYITLTKFFDFWYIKGNNNILLICNRA